MSKSRIKIHSGVPSTIIRIDSPLRNKVFTQRRNGASTGPVVSETVATPHTPWYRKRRTIPRHANFRGVATDTIQSTASGTPSIVVCTMRFRHVDFATSMLCRQHSHHRAVHDNADHRDGKFASPKGAAAARVFCSQRQRVVFLSGSTESRWGEVQ